MPVLEIEIEDEAQCHREHEWAEEPETSSVLLVVHPSAKKDENEVEDGETVLRARVFVVGVAQPLPLEVQPVHPELCGERRLAFTEFGLAVLTAIEVVHEAVVRELTERALRLELGGASRGFAFVDGGEMRRANGLCGKRREAESERHGAGHEQLPAEHRLRAADEHRDAHGGHGQHAGHVVGVSETAEIGDQHEQAIGHGAFGIVTPAHGEPADEGEADE